MKRIKTCKIVKNAVMKQPMEFKPTEPEKYPVIQTNKTSKLRWQYKGTPKKNVENLTRDYKQKWTKREREGKKKKKLTVELDSGLSVTSMSAGSRSFSGPRATEEDEEAKTRTGLRWNWGWWR